MPAPIFSPGDITRIRRAAAQGKTGNEIALMLGRTPAQVRRKCCERGIPLRDLRKHQWHRLRILIEPTLQKAITLAARKRGMRSGDLARRILTAVAMFDLFDVVLDANARALKLGTIANAKPVENELVLITDRPELTGCAGL
jgi:hypothetical protein